MRADLLQEAPGAPLVLVSDTEWKRAGRVVLTPDGFASARFLATWPAGTSLDWRIVYESPGGLDCPSTVLAGSGLDTGALQVPIAGCWVGRLELKLSSGAGPVQVRHAWSRDPVSCSPSA